MKLTLIAFICSLMQVTAATYGQNITLNAKNVPFEEILDNISKQSGYHFLYDEQLLNQSTPVSINVKNLAIEKVLIKCFADQPFSYVVKQNNVIIISRDKPDAQQIAETVNVSGKVTDDKNQPLVGVSVGVKGTTMGMITSKDGTYSISNLKDDAILVFSYIGYQSKEMAINGQSTINVVLAIKDANLNEVIVVGYGTQSRKSLTAAISTVKSDELTAAPVASLTNTLAGRLPGLISQQASGQPGFDAANISIRGFGNALVIVDGIEAPLNNIDPNQIESLSILKDASAAIYGARAGNGVVLITTKRGNNSKPDISFNSSYTLNGITAMPKPVNAGQYAELKTEAWLQSGQPESNVPFTTEQIAKYYNGTDPDYPNTNWYKVLVRDNAPQTENNFSVRGGSDKIKYYGFLGYLNQASMFKKNGGSYQRYNLQSNIDAQINNDLSLQLDISAIYEIRKNPWRPLAAGNNTVWQDYWNTLPIYPAELPDPTKISFANGGGTGGAHVVSNAAISGYDNLNSQNLKGTLALNYNMPFVKGLSAKILVNYLQNYGFEKNFSKPVDFYTYDHQSKIYTKMGTLGTLASLSVTDVQNQTITGQASLSYDRAFHNGDHHLKILGLYEAINYSTNYTTAGRTNFLTPAIDQLFAGNASYQTATGAATEAGRKSYIGRLNYSYLGRYLLESTLRADASSVFPPGKQWGYFPSVSVGWIISEEKFMNKTLDYLDELKIRTSFGRSGLDNVGNYQYLAGYQYGGSYLFGTNPQPGLITTGLANPNLTWEKVKTYNAAIDVSFWKRKLYGTFDLFYRERTGIPFSLISTLPSTFGSALPPVNINSLNNRGFELQIGTSGKANDLSWNISANISWSRSKWQHFEEPIYTDPDQSRTSKQSGNYTDVTYGYKADGLFTSQEQIDNLAFDQDGQENKSLRPGDIRYIDVNNDGVLNYKDMINIGNGTIPNWMGGLNTALKYKSFDIAALFQGAFGYYKNILLSQNGQTYPVQVYDLRWTPANNNPNALVPRLGGAATNTLLSNYYYRNASYLRLKSLTVGYTLPAEVLQKMGFKQFRLYLAGTNLLTFSGLKKYGTDPEAPSGLAGFYYPQQRAFSLGLNASF